ncbi:HD domain-containing phosphohydrolase [Chloroflexota bacterium]
MIGLLNNKKRNPKHKGREPGIDNEELKTRLELLYDVALKASSVAEVSELIEQILAITQSMLKGTASSLLLVEKEEGKLCFQAADGQAGKILKQKALHLDSGIADWVSRNQKPLVIKDAYKDKRFNQNVDKITNFTTKSVIAVPLIKGKKTIGVLEVLNKTDAGEFDEKDLAILTGFASTEAVTLLVSMAHTAINNIAAHDEWLNGYKKTAEALAQASDAKEAYATGHSQRVREYTMLAADSLSLAPDELQAIELGALLHDIGKIGVDEEVLRKPGPLTDEEWASMREHSEIGANIVGEIPFLEKTKPIVLHHHERYDGKGYPKGLKDEHIPIGARLVAVADAFDTMTTKHPYQEALTAEKAIEELLASAGTQFCPVAVEAFVSARKGSAIPPAAATEHIDEEAASPVIEEAELVGEEVGTPKEESELPKDARKNQKKGGAAHDTDTEIFEGEIELVLPDIGSMEQVKRLKTALKKTENLRISMSGWSEDEGQSITISLSKPLPLLKILKEMPAVEDASTKGGKLTVILNTILTG